MSNIESLFCKEELGDDWYAGGKTPPNMVPALREKVHAGQSSEHR